MTEMIYRIVTQNVGNYLSTMSSAETLEQGFSALENFVCSLGFDAITYSAMPTSLGEPGLFQPVFLSSSDFSSGFLTHYDEAALWQDDFTIERIQQGNLAPVDWNKSLRSNQLSKVQKDVINIAKHDYGIVNAVSIPTQSDSHVIAGASITSCNAGAGYDHLIKENLQTAQGAVHRFHQFVFHKPDTTQRFYKPLIDSFTEAEKRVLIFSAMGRPLKQSRDFIDLSPTRTSNILRDIRQRLNVANSNELFLKVGHHKLLEMMA